MHHRSARGQDGDYPMAAVMPWCALHVLVPSAARRMCAEALWLTRSLMVLAQGQLPCPVTLPTCSDWPMQVCKGMTSWPRLGTSPNGHPATELYFHTCSIYSIFAGSSDLNQLSPRLICKASSLISLYLGPAPSF